MFLFELFASLHRFCVFCRCGWVSEQSASMWRRPAMPQSTWFLSLWMPDRLSVWFLQEDVCRYVGSHTHHHHHQMFLELFMFCLSLNGHCFTLLLPFLPLPIHGFITLLDYCTVCPSSLSASSAALVYYSTVGELLLFPRLCCLILRWPLGYRSCLLLQSTLLCPCCCSLCLWFTMLWLS